jgi:hypothetical protein
MERNGTALWLQMANTKTGKDKVYILQTLDGTGSVSCSLAASGTCCIENSGPANGDVLPVQSNNDISGDKYRWSA